MSYGSRERGTTKNQNNAPPYLSGPTHETRGSNANYFSGIDLMDGDLDEQIGATRELID